ncbi:hypothetical protein ACGFZA_07800 [Streptomyces sp. NPDC048211]|uniref:hypothetical protein n=1 Tax=Streptomyces sp. NPDC048211 TaxID=3365516 RepID=UPI003719DFCB
MTAPTPRSCCKTGACFTCKFWEEKTRWAESGEMPAIGRHAAAPVARVDGWHYIVKPLDTTSPPQFLGFSGAMFTFRFADGRQLTSNDVMCQGEIPTHFRDRLPDNAVIVPQTLPRATVPFGEFEGLS